MPGGKTGNFIWMLNSSLLPGRWYPTQVLQSWRRYFLTGCHFSHPLARLSRFALGRLAPDDLTNSFLPSPFFLFFSLSFLLWFSLPFGVWEREFFKKWKMCQNKNICSHIAELFSAAGEIFGYLKCELHSRTPLVVITKFECSIFSLLTPNFGLPGKTSANPFSRDRFFWRFAPRFFFWYPGW